MTIHICIPVLAKESLVSNDKNLVDLEEYNAYNVEIKYVKEKYNVVADAPSTLTA